MTGSGRMVRIPTDGDCNCCDSWLKYVLLGPDVKVMGDAGHGRAHDAELYVADAGVEGEWR